MRDSKVCADCQKKALFMRPRKGKRVKTDKEHTLCFRHFRDEMNRYYAVRLRVDAPVHVVVV